MNSYTAICADLFTAFFFFMMAAALTVKRAVKRQSYSGRALHLAMLLGSFAMGFAPFNNWGFLGFSLIPPSPLSGELGTAVCGAGVGFCLWARLTLGRNWSGTVTLKKDHELIQRGPYALARHPMYTGILTGLLGAAVTGGQWGNFLGVALLFFAMTRKMAMEETYMTDHFGRAYADYSREVKRLIPFVY